MESPREGLAAVVFEDRIWAIGGLGQAQYLKSVEVYDPDRDEWTPGPSLATPRYCLAAAVAHGGIYALGGFSGESESEPGEPLGTLATVERLDSADGAWRPAPSMTSPREAAAAFVLQELQF